MIEGWVSADRRSGLIARSLVQSKWLVLRLNLDSRAFEARLACGIARCSGIGYIGSVDSTGKIGSSWSALVERRRRELSSSGQIR